MAFGSFRPEPVACTDSLDTRNRFCCVNCRSMVTVKVDGDWNTKSRLYDPANPSLMSNHCSLVGVPAAVNGNTWSMPAPPYYPEAINVNRPDPKLQSVLPESDEGPFSYMTVKYDRRNGQMSLVSRPNSSNQKATAGYDKLHRLSTGVSTFPNHPDRPRTFNNFFVYNIDN